MSLTTEPAVIISGVGAVVEALVVLLITFGVPITEAQKGAIDALVTILLTLLTGILIRGQVTPAIQPIPAPISPVISPPPPAVPPTP